MLGLSPPRIFQCRNVRALDGPTAMGNPIVSVGPSLRRGIFKPPKPLATARVRAAQHSRVASAPRRITVPTRAVIKSAFHCPAEPFAITFAPLREWLRVKITSLPERISPRGFKVLQAFRSNRRFMVSTSSPKSCGLRRNAFTPALRATASESVPDIITIGIHRR